MQRVFIRLLLGILTFFAVIRLATFLLRFGHESLQMDFAAFYTAGEALNSGLSPYENHVTHNPPIWDGVDVFQHSRFLYPPLAAVLFQPVALLPYAVAKYVWMLLNLSSVACSSFLTIKLINLAERPEWLWVLTIFASTFYPLLTLLERGQIDGITLLFITLAIRLMIRGNAPHADVLAGLYLGIATLLKLHCVYIVPFLLVRKRWATAGGYILSLLGILLLSIAVSPHLSLDYVRNELPRIARFGEGGDESMKLPTEVIQVQIASLPEGYTTKGGRIYRYESFHAISNASVVRSVASLLRKVGYDVHPSVLSMLVFFGFFLAMWIGRSRSLFISQRDETFRELAYWQGALVSILLSAPLTWVMNTVWLLPVAGTILYGYIISKSRCERLVLSVGLLGLLVAWISDRLLLLLLTPSLVRLANAKYLFSEIALLLALCCWK